MEGLSKLKELDYLNLALNNISMVEGIEGCESLRKLDLTVNFIDVEDLQESLFNLRANIMLQDLYLTGNPCQDWHGFRAYTVAQLPRLKQLDGQIILPTERIIARQRLPELQQDLELAVQASLARKASQAGKPVSAGAYTKESRNEMYFELAAQKEEKERNERRRMGTEPKPPREIPSAYNARGEIRQCNEGKYDFNISDDIEPGKVVFELSVPKYLDTSAMEVDVNPLYVRVVVRDKVTQLKLPAEVRPDTSVVKRSRATGHMLIVMPMVSAPSRSKKAAPEPDVEPLKPALVKKERCFGKVSTAGIYCDGSRVSKSKPDLIREVRTTRVNGDMECEDDGVPPLLPPRRALC